MPAHDSCFLIFWRTSSMAGGGLESSFTHGGFFRKLRAVGKHYLCSHYHTHRLLHHESLYLCPSQIYFNPFGRICPLPNVNGMKSVLPLPPSNTQNQPKGTGRSDCTAHLPSQIFRNHLIREAYTWTKMRS